MGGWPKLPKQTDELHCVLQRSRQLQCRLTFLLLHHTVALRRRKLYQCAPIVRGLASHQHLTLPRRGHQPGDGHGYLWPALAQSSVGGLCRMAAGPDGHATPASAYERSDRLYCQCFGFRWPATFHQFLDQRRNSTSRQRALQLNPDDQPGCNRCRGLSTGCHQRVRRGDQRRGAAGGSLRGCRRGEPGNAVFNLGHGRDEHPGCHQRSPLQ